MTHFGFREKTDARRIPEAVQEYLKKRFLLRADYIGELRCFDDEGMLDGQTVMQVHIFSPALARKKGLLIRDKGDLQRHPEVLFFEGYVSALGKVYLADRRLPEPAPGRAE